MEYQIKKRSSANEEYQNFCSTYGEEPSSALQDWFDNLRDEAQKRDYIISVSLEEPCSTTLTAFADGTIKEKYQIFMSYVKNLQPPRELRYSKVPLQIFFRECEVEAFYEVEHDARRIVITQLILPPYE